MSRILSENRFLVLIFCSTVHWLGCRCDSETSLPAPADTLTTADFEQASSAIIGSVYFEGSPPEPRVWRTGLSDPACARAGSGLIASEEIIINTNGTLRNVFVYVSSNFATLQFPLPSEPAILDQRGCRYVPRVLGLRAGQTLLILNGDSTMHNVHAASKQNGPFNIGMTSAVKKISRVFDRPEVMIPINCNVHPWMSAYAGVLNHPFFAVTNTEGTFQLGLLPPGEYEITAWHEHFGVSKQTVKLEASEQRHIDFNFKAR